jgi:chemotaxis protein MotB
MTSKLDFRERHIQQTFQLSTFAARNTNIMKSNLFLILALVSIFALPSCVGKKKFVDLQGQKAQTDLALEEALQRIQDLQTGRTADNERLNSTLRNKEAELAREKARAETLADQMNILNTTNQKLLDNMAANQVTSAAEAKSIQASLEKINNQSGQIEKLNRVIRVKDSTNVALVYNLKKSLENLNDEDIDVQVKGTKVFVSISDKLLFSSGQADIGPRAGEVLSKVARVVKDNQDLEVTIEGHTDNVPISSAKFPDNWALSGARAIAVTETLIKNYGVAPGRLSAAARGEFSPKADNSTPEGRAMNRRTEIILTPKLDQFFKLLEAPETIREK